MGMLEELNIDLINRILLDIAIFVDSELNAVYETSLAAL
jgi:hypothetical protein